MFKLDIEQIKKVTKGQKIIVIEDSIKGKKYFYVLSAYFGFHVTANTFYKKFVPILGEYKLIKDKSLGNVERIESTKNTELVHMTVPNFVMHGLTDCPVVIGGNPNSEYISIVELNDDYYRMCKYREFYVDKSGSIAFFFESQNEKEYMFLSPLRIENLKPKAIEYTMEAYDIFFPDKK